VAGVPHRYVFAIAVDVIVRRMRGMRRHFFYSVRVVKKIRVARSICSTFNDVIPFIPKGGSRKMRIGYQ
jgi:hypothetical protein